jgi:hypothetical protein
MSYDRSPIIALHRSNIHYKFKKEFTRFICTLAFIHYMRENRSNRRNRTIVQTLDIYQNLLKFFTYYHNYLVRR